MSKKILIVDDDATNRKLLKTVLSKKEGIEVEEASNGVEALEKLSSDVKVVLLDIYMPVMDGIQFLQRLKTQPELSNIPIIVISTDDEKKNEALSWGATDFLVKPVNSIELWEKISKYL